MATSEEFLKHLTNGDTVEAVQAVLNSLIQLTIVTRISDDASDPSREMRTSISLVDGTIETQVGQQFLNEGPYTSLQEGHMRQVASACSSMRDNIESIQSLVALMRQSTWEPTATPYPLTVEGGLGRDLLEAGEAPVEEFGDLGVSGDSLAASQELEAEALSDLEGLNETNEGAIASPHPGGMAGIAAAGLAGVAVAGVAGLAAAETASPIESLTESPMESPMEDAWGNEFDPAVAPDLAVSEFDAGPGELGDSGEEVFAAGLDTSGLDDSLDSGLDDSLDSGLGNSLGDSFGEDLGQDLDQDLGLDLGPDAGFGSEGDLDFGDGVGDEGADSFGLDLADASVGDGLGSGEELQLFDDGSESLDLGELGSADLDSAALGSVELGGEELGADTLGADAFGSELDLSSELGTDPSLDSLDLGLGEMDAFASGEAVSVPAGDELDISAPGSELDSWPGEDGGHFGETGAPTEAIAFEAEGLGIESLGAEDLGAEDLGVEDLGIEGLGDLGSMDDDPLAALELGGDDLDNPFDGNEGDLDPLAMDELALEAVEDLEPGAEELAGVESLGLGQADFGMDLGSDLGGELADNLTGEEPLLDFDLGDADSEPIFDAGADFDSPELSFDEGFGGDALGSDLGENPFNGENPFSMDEFPGDEQGVSAGDDFAFDASALEEIEDFDSELWDEASPQPGIEDSLDELGQPKRVSRSLESLFASESNTPDLLEESDLGDLDVAESDGPDPLAALFSDASLDDLEDLDISASTGSDADPLADLDDNPFELDALDGDFGNDPFADLMMDSGSNP